jgi:hypothetical protein
MSGLPSGTVRITDSAKKAFVLMPGVTTIFYNPKGEFELEGLASLDKQPGIIALFGVPCERRSVTVHVNHYDHEMAIGNNGRRDQTKILRLEIGTAKYSIENSYQEVVVPGPAVLVWDTQSTDESLNVRVTATVNPLPLLHAMELTFTTQPLAEALRQANKPNEFMAFLRTLGIG